MEMKLLFSWVLALCISCVFTIEIDQNIDTESDQSDSQEDPDVSYGRVNFIFPLNL